jgi:hypothetical protein
MRASRHLSRTKRSRDGRAVFLLRRCRQLKEPTSDAGKEALQVFDGCVNAALIVSALASVTVRLQRSSGHA